MARYTGARECPKVMMPLIAVLTVLALAVMSFMTAGAASAVVPGNNGTLKVHEAGTPSGTESNDPKVCVFNFEAFRLDAGQGGYLMIDVQGGDQPQGTSAGPFAVGPANADGYFASMYFNDADGPVIVNGHYKATLFGKQLPSGKLTDVKAKSKVLKVDCPAVPPVPPNPPQPPVPPNPPVPPQPPVPNPPNPPVPPTPNPPVHVKKVMGAVKMVDKCGRAADAFLAKRVKGVTYLVKGKVIREGVWLKPKTKVVKVHAVASSKKYKVVGQTHWVLKFSTKPCAPPPNISPPTGA